MVDFIDQLRGLASRIESTKSIVQTEEATKTAMIMPFIQILGYNVFDPTEVTPELIADIGTKKGEKVDYAILKEGKPIIIFECKKCDADLSVNHAGQLFRYFHVTEARFAVLTNGLAYRFFTDLEQPNKMDEKPFLEFNILDFKDQEVDELKKFTKSSFDLDTILATASELKYTRSIRNLLSEWMSNPSEEFVRILSADLLSGRRFTPSVKDQFSTITKRAFQQLIGDKINERLKVAMKPEDVIATPLTPKEAKHTATEIGTKKVVTKNEEIEGYYMVKAILRDSINPHRVFMRDAQSYCAVLLDDNNRKSVCRLWFNNPEKLVLGLLDGKEEERVSLQNIDDIFNYADRIKAAAVAYGQNEDL